MTEIPLSARKFKLAVPVPADALPPVSLEGPIGDVTILLALEGSALVIPARVNGKNYRRVLRTVAEKGAANVTVILQGDLVATPEGGVRLESAGFQVVERAAKATEGR
jgi:hypothetical protein